MLRQGEQLIMHIAYNADQIFTPVLLHQPEGLLVPLHFQRQLGIKQELSLKKQGFIGRGGALHVVVYLLYFSQ